MSFLSIPPARSTPAVSIPQTPAIPAPTSASIGNWLARPAGPVSRTRRPARRGQKPRQAGEEGDEAQAAENEQPAAEHDRVGVRLVPGEDLASGRVFGRAVVVDQDDPDHPEGDGERTDEGLAAVLGRIHSAALLSRARARAGTVRTRRRRVRTFERAERVSEMDA